MHAVQSYLISFSCFVENNSKTTALESLLFVKSACLQQRLSAAAGTLTSTGFDFMQPRSTSYDLALCARVTTETECERTGWMRTYSVLFAVCCFLTSKATADSSE